MDKLLKRIADLILAFVALLGLLNFLPIKIEVTDILIITSIIFFILFIVLITHQVSKLEEKFKREDELKDIRKDIEALKLILIKKWTKKGN